MTEGLITTLAVGVIIIVLGAINMTGNISSLHSYHRHRVSEEDRKPFGKLVGLGTILSGLGVVILGISTFAFESHTLAFIGGIVFGVLFALGLEISFYAMIKYNKGIF